MPTNPYADIAENPYADIAEGQSDSPKPVAAAMVPQKETQFEKDRSFVNRSIGATQPLSTAPGAIGQTLKRAAEGISDTAKQAWNDPKGFAKGVVKGTGELWGAAFGAPIDKDSGPLGERIEQFKKEYAQDPATAVKNAAGDVLSMYLQGKIIEGVGEGVKPATRAVGNALRGAPKTVRETLGPGKTVARELVKQTGDENTAAQTKAQKENAAAEEARQGKMKAVSGQRAEVKSGVEEAKAKAAAETAKQAKIAPTNAKLDEAHGNLQAGIETAREKALGVGNEKYSAVNEKLNPIEARPEFYGEVYGEAGNTLSGSAPEPTFLQNIEKRMKAKEPIRYEDLQADYSRLGRELSKGTLPGDVYHAYDLAHEAIGNEMQRIADANGMGPQLTDARNYWRRMKQAFGKSHLMTDEGTEALRVSDPERYAKAVQAKRVNLQGSFDPRLAGLHEHIRNLQTGADALPKPKPAREIQRPVTEANKPLPKPPVKEPPVVAETKTIGTEEMRAKNAEKVEKTANQLRDYGFRHGIYIAGAALPASIMAFVTGHPIVGVVGELTSGPMAIGTVHAIANLLEKPEVIKFLSEPTAEQIAAIPPEMRGKIQPIVEQARKQGIQVNPRLLQAVGTVSAEPRKKVGDFLK